MFIFIQKILETTLVTTHQWKLQMQTQNLRRKSLTMNVLLTAIKIFIKQIKKLEKLTLRGKSNLYEYHKYIDELVDKGQYSQFKDCLNRY